MAAPRKFDVLVDGQVVYTGLLRVAEQVYDACCKSVVLASPMDHCAPFVVLAVHMEGGDLHV